MKKFWLFISVLIISFIFFGCQAGDSGASKENIAKWNQEKDWKAEVGDWLMLRLSSDPPTLNPVVASDTSSSAINSKIYDSLMEISDDLKLIPNLVEAFEVSPDGLVFTFHLKDGLKWNDGKPLTTKDVKFTYDVIMDPQNQANNKRAGYENVRKFEVVDKLTFKVHYAEPFAPALLKWTMTVIPEHIFKKDALNHTLKSSSHNLNPVGNGPFILESWQENKKVVLKANDKYFRGRPYFDKVIYRIIPEQAVVFQMMQIGQIDNSIITPQQYELAKQKPDVGDKIFSIYDVKEYYAPSYTYVGWNMTGQNPFFTDKKVRQAMTYAIDRQSIVKNLLFGHAELISGPFYLKSWAYNHDVKPIPFDDKKAEKLLDEAGWELGKDGIREKNGIKFEFELLVPSSSSTGKKVAAFMQASYKKLGIIMNIKQLEWSTFLKKTYDTTQFTAYLAGWSLGLDPDPYAIWHSSQTETGLNKIGYRNTEVDKLIEKGRREMDLGKRSKLYNKVHELIADDQPYLFLYIRTDIETVHKRIKNTVFYPYGWYNMTNVGFPDAAEGLFDKFLMNGYKWDFKSYKGAFVPKELQLYPGE